MADQKQFTFSRVVHLTQQSQEIGSSEISVVGVKKAQVACACGHEWSADERSGLRNVMGGVHITCPSCRADGNFNLRQLAN